MASILSGAAFGASQVAAGIYNPVTVMSGLKLEDWHVVQAFAGATGSSALIYAIAEWLGYIRLSPRSSSPTGLFGQYDGNVIGGLLLGTGMAISGACPGTVLSQAAVGLRTGPYALAGAVLGGIAWSGPISKLVRAQRERAGVKPETNTLDRGLGLSRLATVFVVDALCLGAVAATVTYGNDGSEFTLFSAGGGLFIGLAQLVSIFARGSLLGVSGAYEELGSYFWWLLRGAKSSAPGYKNMMFASGVGAGAWAAAQAFPSLLGNVDLEPSWVTVLGGFSAVIGSRLAGGCTSGHGISGISLLSTSSLVTMASTFLGGALVAKLV